MSVVSSKVAARLAGAGLGLLLAAGMGAPARAGVADIQISNRGTVAFQAANSRLWVADTNGGGKELNFEVMPGTSPAISPGTNETTTHTGTVVFQGKNGNLWAAAAGATAGRDHGVAMAPGTSPAISTDRSKIAFQGANGNLWTTDSRQPKDSGTAMAPGTSPSLAHPNRIAFHGADGFLWTSAGGRSGHALAPGTSPTVSQDGVIAFQGANGTLWIIRVGGQVVNTGFAMAPLTSPVIATISADWNLLRIAFQGSDGQLHSTAVHPDRRNKDWGLDMMAGTSPAVSASGSDMAFHGANGQLHSVNGSDRHRDLGFAMAAGTNPA